MEPQPQIITTQPKKKTNKTLIFGILGVLLLVGAVFAGVRLVGQRQLLEQQAAVREAKGPFLANTTESSFSVWWRGSTPQSACATITPVLGGQPIEMCDNQKTVAHLITFSDLPSATQYTLKVQHGDQTLTLDPFFGNGAWTRKATSTKQPISAFGQVLNNKSKPVINASVFITPNKTDRFYMPVATLTDKSGNFNFNNLQLLDTFTAEPADSYILEVISQDGVNLVEQVITSNNLSPIPTITVQ